MKKWPKGYLLAALLLSLLAVGQVIGYNQYVVTRFADLRCTDILLDGNDILDSSGTTRITVGATNTITGNATVTGSLTVTGALTGSGTGYFTLQVSTAPRSATVGVTPTSAGQLIYNSTDRELCMSTGTTLNTWVQVSSANVTACAH